MAQEDILNYIIRQGNKPVSLAQISRALNINRTNVARACRQLKKAKEIKVIPKREANKSRLSFLIKLR